MKRCGSSHSKEVMWLCRCCCGNTHLVSGYSLRSVHTKSCGCLKNEKSATRFTKHGHRKNNQKSKTYRTWENIISRCKNPNHQYYYLYGGRGIGVCRRLKKFENFLADMGEPPTVSCQIDRIDNNDHYKPGNCRWVEPQQNARNKRNNCILTYDGKTKSLPEWSEELGINRHTLWCRIFRYNWSVAKALTTKANGAKPNEQNNTGD